MTASSLQRLASVPKLRATWKVFWRASGTQRTSGVDGITPRQFNRNVDRHLERIRRELLAGYRFSLLRGHPVLKKNGKSWRIICIPTVQDRIVQRLVAGHLTEKADRLGIINEVSYGFIPTSTGKRRGHIAARDTAVAVRCNHKWAYKSDISSFFDRIPRDELVKQTVSALRTPSLKPLIEGAVSCEIDESDRAVARIAQANGIVRGLGVRQGMPLSPMFANIILRSFDEGMTKQGIQMVRYADDFIVLADSEDECHQVDTFARNLLSPLGLELPPLGHKNSKTYIAHPDDDIEFLGLALTPDGFGSYKLLVTNDQLKNIGRTINRLKDIEQLVQEGIDLTGLVRRVENRTGGYLAAYKDAHNIDELRNVLENSRNGILRSVFVKAFGERAVHALSSNMRKFLLIN